MAVILAAGLSTLLPAQQSSGAQVEIEPVATQALDHMGAYLRTLKSFQVTADVTTEEVLEDGLKVQFSHKTNLMARMPDRLFAEIEGDRKHRLMFYDGKSFTFYAARAGYYATVAAPPTLGQLVEIASDKYEIEIPLADLFMWGGPRATTSTITTATVIGPSQVGGVSCDHYVFRQPGIDWQVWIQKGDYPLPRKLVITSTTDDARPQHVSVLTWNLAPAYNDAIFTFDPPAGANKIVFGEDKAASAAAKN